MMPSGLFYVIDNHGIVTLLQDSVQEFAEELNLPAGEITMLARRSDREGFAWAQ